MTASSSLRRGDVATDGRTLRRCDERTFVAVGGSVSVCMAHFVLLVRIEFPQIFTQSPYVIVPFFSVPGLCNRHCCMSSMSHSTSSTNAFQAGLPVSTLCTNINRTTSTRRQLLPPEFRNAAAAISSTLWGDVPCALSTQKKGEVHHPASTNSGTHPPTTSHFTFSILQ